MLTKCFLNVKTISSWLILSPRAPLPLLSWIPLPLGFPFLFDNLPSSILLWLKKKKKNKKQSLWIQCLALTYLSLAEGKDALGLLHTGRWGAHLPHRACPALYYLLISVCLICLDSTYSSPQPLPLSCAFSPVLSTFPLYIHESRFSFWVSTFNIMHSGGGGELDPAATI